jgi:polyisoprenoid-binding protein YceI
MTALPLVVALAAGSNWSIDPAHAQAKFTVRHMMVMDVTGTLGKVSGTIDLNDKDPTKSKVDVSIEVDPQTQEEKRDKHLRSHDFFDVEKFPKATFTAKTIKKAGKDKFKVTGPLQLRDVSKDVTFEVTLSPEFPNPFNKSPTRAVVATATINRLDWGLTWQVPMANSGLYVGNDVKIELSAEIKPPEPPQAEADDEKGETGPGKDAGAAPAKPAPAPAKK